MNNVTPEQLKQLPCNVDRALQVCAFMHFYSAEHIMYLELNLLTWNWLYRQVYKKLSLKLDVKLL